MTDMELAEEIEQVILAGNKVGIPLASIIKMGFTSQQWNEIIAALRRERPPSGEMVMVPKNELEALRNIEDCIFGNEGVGSAEEFYLRDLAVWSLIDEVEALRRGVGFTHVGPDPILRLKDKWLGVCDREGCVSTLAMVRASRERATMLSAAEVEGRKS